jgi:hypothetical protein
MRFLLLLAVLNSSYFVEWIPNNATAPPPTTTTSSSPGEFPWQLSR